MPSLPARYNVQCCLQKSLDLQLMCWLPPLVLQLTDFSGEGCCCRLDCFDCCSGMPTMFDRSQKMATFKAIRSPLLLTRFTDVASTGCSKAPSSLDCLKPWRMCRHQHCILPCTHGKLVSSGLPLSPSLHTQAAADGHSLNCVYSSQHLCTAISPTDLPLADSCPV